tara:strand:+ start:1499 stop:1708 length:210 start_codon:yes stop_codon:yes gene_type:complete
VTKCGAISLTTIWEELGDRLPAGGDEQEPAIACERGGRRRDQGGTLGGKLILAQRNQALTLQTLSTSVV